MDMESREFSRSPVTAHVEVSLDNGILVEGVASDISLRGLRLKTEYGLPVGKPVHIRIVLQGDVPHCALALQAQVARVEDSGVALEFTGVDADSIEHLRRLILYNSPNAEQAQEEIAAHIGIERRC